MELLEQRQGKQGVAGSLLDGPQRCLQAAFAGGGDDEPQVVAVLALVVVIDLGKTVDRSCHRLESLRRHGHCRQRRGADALRREDRPDARNLALAAQLFETAQNRALANAEARRQLGKRRRTEREIALEFVEQAEFEGVVHRHLRSQCAQRAW